MASTTLTPQRATATALDFKKLLKRKRLPFRALYLFGSYAKLKHRAWSDVDIAVVSNRFGKDFVRESVTLNALADTINPLIQAHPIHPSHLKDKYSTLAEEIRRHGKKI
ncbi:nucleotidyltransferase domain-containing protein [Candidatus Uhrbacteria bacterium]|nr:nucleotidyltransferase domain-containing protein [Candidatus Uhrbacteria bacterium]